MCWRCVFFAIFINSIIFSGKLGSYTLKATVGAFEQQFIINIEKPGPLGPGSKIVIKDRENICKKRDKKVVWTNETCFLGFVHDNETKQATLTVTDKHGNAKQHQKFYVYMNYTGGNFAELETDANGDYKIEFKPKRINKGKTKSNLIGDFIWTILDSGAHPTRAEYDIPELIIRFKNENGVRKDILKIKHKNITKEIYEEIKSKIY